MAYAFAKFYRGGVNYHSTMITLGGGVDGPDLAGHPPGAGVVGGGRGAVVIWGRWRQGGKGIAGGMTGRMPDRRRRRGRGGGGETATMGGRGRPGRRCTAAA